MRVLRIHNFRKNPWMEPHRVPDGRRTGSRTRQPIIGDGISDYYRCTS